MKAPSPWKILRGPLEFQGRPPKGGGACRSIRVCEFHLPCRYKKLRITGMYFILNLAVSNLIATTVTAPLIIHTIRQVTYCVLEQVEL